MEVAQIVTHLLQPKAECEETLRFLCREAPRQTIIANCCHCRRTGIKRRFYAIDVGRQVASEERGCTSSKEIAEGRRDFSKMLETFM